MSASVSMSVSVSVSVPLTVCVRSNSIQDGVIQQGDSDPEFLGRFEANQTLAAFSPEELLDEQLARCEAFSLHALPGCRGEGKLEYGR